MPTKKTSQRSAQPSSRDTSRLKPLRGAFAVRYRTGHDGEVRATLSALGRVELHPSKHMAVFQRSAGVGRAAVEAALDSLKSRRAIDFVAPVLVDPDSHTRQVPTDEILLRLKPGRTQRVLKSLREPRGLTISRRNEFEPSQYVLKVPTGSATETLEIARELDSSEDVEFAAPNFLTEIKR